MTDADPAASMKAAAQARPAMDPAAAGGCRFALGLTAPTDLVRRREVKEHVGVRVRVGGTGRGRVVIWPGCPHCRSGVGQPVELVSNPVSVAGGRSMIVFRGDGFECPTCHHRWTKDPRLVPLLLGAMCDFCRDEEPAAGFPCGDFAQEHGGIREEFIGDWAACQRCAALVRAGERDRLAVVAVEAFVRRLPAIAAALPAGQLARDVRRRHDGFWAHRV